MKKFLLKSLIFISIVSAGTMYAQIPNASFEEWINVSGIEKPVGWTTYDGDLGAPNTITPYTPGYNSDTAAQMKVMTFNDSPWVSDLLTGFLCNKRYPIMEGYLKSLNPHKDTLEISISFYNKKSPIGSGDFQTDTNATNFYKFSIPIVFTNGDNPDSASVFITYLSGNPSVEDAFIIDNLNLPFNASIQSVSNPTGFAIGNIYPMPANDMIHIPIITTKPTEVQTNLYDIEGRQYVSTVKEINDAGLNNIEVSVAGIPKGIYFITLQNKDGYRITRKIIIG